MNQERTLLLVRFVLVVTFGGAIGYMLTRAWVPGSMLYDLGYEIAGLFEFGPGVAMEKFSSAMLGLYAGLIMIFMLDWRKRVQGALLFVGTVIALLVMAEFGILLPRIDISAVNILFFMAGLATGIGTQYRAIQRHLTQETPLSEIEFNGAITGIFFLFTVIPVLGLAQTLIAGTSIMLIDVPCTVLFVYTLIGFISYDSKITTAILGPQSSGKTMTILGLFQRFSERDDTPVRPTSILSNLVGWTDTMVQGDDFPAPHTSGSNNEIGFYFQAGDLFPIQSRFSTFDHAGELIEDIADAVEDTSLRTRLSVMWYWVKNLLPGDQVDDKTQLYNHVRSASMVVLVIDVQRLEEEDRPYLEELQTIASALNKRNATVRIIATKCDLLVDEFTNNSRIIQDPERDDVLYGEDDADYTSFSEWVTNKLTTERIQVRNIMKETDQDKIYPVWFRTVEQGNVRIPDLDENNNLQPAGFDALVDELEEEAIQNV